MDSVRPIDGARAQGAEVTATVGRYTIRFSPRKPRSNWRAINIKRARELIERKLMKPAGRKAFDTRKKNKTGLYSYENRPTELDEAYAKTFRRDKAAWAFFQAQPPSYRKMASWWVTSAKQEETRQRRLARLIADSAARRRI